MRFADLNPVARLTAAAIHLGLSFLISSALIRDEGLLESALARPENLAAYGEPDEAALAAAYAFGLAKNHPFIDSNKRAPFLALDASEITEAAFAAWIRAHSSRRA